MKSFLDFEANRILIRTERFFVIEDGFPVSKGHCLIISKDIKKTYFDLSVEERYELVDVIDQVKRLIEERHSPDGFNIGMNCGEAAGQTIMHFH